MSTPDPPSELEWTESQGLLEAIYDQGLFAGRINVNGIVLDANRASLESCGFKREDVIGKPFWECGWWNRSPEVQEWVRKAVTQAARGEPFRGESRYFWANGSEHVVDFSCIPIKDEEGRVVVLAPTGMDITERASARAGDRQAIEESEERLRLAQSAAHVGTWEWDPTHARRKLSPELQRIFGLDPEDPDHAQTWASRVHTDDQERVQELMYEGYASGSMEFEYRYQHPELGLRWLFCKGRKIAEGRMLGIIQDITDRKVSEEALRESEERLRAIVETTPECVKVVARDGTLLHMNSSGLAMVGADCPQMVVGKNVYDLIAPEDRDDFRQFNEQVCDGQRGSLEFDIIGLGGVRRHMETHAAPLRNADGSVVQLAITRDITLRQQTRVAAQRLAAIVESSDDAIVSKDLNGIVTSWNRAAERIFGYPAAEIVGQPINIIIPPELQDDEPRILSTIARGERIDHFETVRLTKGGERRDVSITVSPMKDENGRIVGAAKIARDITDRKRTEAALRTTERLASVGRLAATVAHEINNPLEAVGNLIYLAKAQAASDDVRHYLNAAEEELERVALLTRQTLGFYRETKGAMPMSVGSTIAPLISVYSSRVRKKGSEISTDIRQDPTIHAVPGEIRQLVANLLVNSIDAVDSGGRICIRLSAAQERKGRGRPGVRLTIADSGPGIPAEVRARLFEPFFTTKKDVGTGLGLWICKGIVERHGGSIRVRTRDLPNKHWTVFSVFLPRDPGKETLAIAG